METAAAREKMTAGLRDARIDHYKFFLITCIVFGHLIEPALTLNTVAPLYFFIYLFHIPAFVFIAGMFTRPDKIWPRIFNLAALLIIFQALYFLYAPLVGEEIEYVRRPYWILWFMLSLIYWTLLSPIFNNMKGALLVAVLIALAAGYVDYIGYTWGLSRSAYFLPFFVLGLRHGAQLVHFLRDRRIWGFAGLGLCIVIFLCVPQPIDVRLFYGGQDYNDLNHADIFTGPIVRLGMFAWSVLALLSFIPLMPKKETPLAQLGAGTLAVFLLHGFLILALRPVMEAVFEDNAPAGYALALVLTAAMVLIFSRPIFTRILNMPGKWAAGWSTTKKNM